jgi:ParB family transcriptional regulator, chromosome partitioning protein
VADEGRREAKPARGMGRGLAALLEDGSPRGAGLQELPIELVRPNERQPRREIGGESLLHLRDSIEERGVLQPIVVRPLPGGDYELIAGERRLRAAKMAGLERIPAIVRETKDDERLELALIENVAREDLNPVDQARACATLVDDLGVTQEQLGRRIGKSRVAVSNLIRLLDLPDEALALVESGELTEGHGRALLVCKDHARRKRLARDARDKDWSVRETERRARQAQAGGGSRAREAIVLHPDLQDALGAAEDALTAALGHDVKVRPKRVGCRVEFDLESPREGVELAERILRRAAA